MTTFKITEEHALEAPSSELMIYDAIPHDGTRLPETEHDLSVSGILATFPQHTLARIPPEMRIILTIFDDGPDGEMPDLARILTAGLHTPEGHPNYHEIRRKQAEDIQRHLTRTYVNVKVNTWLLGYLLSWILSTEIYHELGYMDLKEMCKDLNIEPKTIKEALNLLEVIPYVELVTGQDIFGFNAGRLLTETKIKSLLGMRRKQNEDLERITEGVLKEHHVLPENSLQKKPSMVLQSLNTQEQQSLQNEVQRRYKEQKAEQIQILSELETSAVIDHFHKRAGRPKPACIVLENVEYDGRRVTYKTTGSFECGPAQVAALLKNQLTVRFELSPTSEIVAGSDPQALLTLRAFGEQIEPYCDQSVMDEYDDDDDDDDDLL